MSSQIICKHSNLFRLSERLLEEAKNIIDDDSHDDQRSEEMIKKSKNMLVTCCGYLVCATYKLFDVLFDYKQNSHRERGVKFFLSHKRKVNSINFFEIILHCLNNTAQSRGLLPSGALSRTD